MLDLHLLSRQPGTAAVHSPAQTATARRLTAQMSGAGKQRGGDVRRLPQRASLCMRSHRPDGAFPRPQSVATAACSTILPAHIFHAQLFTNGGKSSVARPAFFSPHEPGTSGRSRRCGRMDFFFLTAISHDSRMFSDVFGPHFPAASSPRAHGKRSASYMLCPANLFPFRMRSVMATANSRDASRFLSAVDWTDAQKQRCQRARRRTSRA